MVADNAGSHPGQSHHAPSLNDRVVGAAERQAWQETICAILVAVELALWDTQYTKLDHGSPVDELERMYTTLNVLAAALRLHGEKIREHEAALVRHHRQASEVAGADESEWEETASRISVVVQNEQQTFRKRFKDRFDMAMRQARCLIETRSGAL